MPSAAVGQFEGKVALVTGASFGIGKATAEAFAREGAAVVLADIKDEDGRSVAARLKDEGARAIYIHCDVSQEREVKNLVQETIRVFGRLDYAFNNAGIEGTPSPTHECADENWNRTLDINLKGAWLCMKHEIPTMLSQGGGVIVNCASIAGLVGFANLPAYVASKHGLVGLTKSAALEYARSGIRVNAVCPGVIHTPMIDRFTGGNVEALKQFEQSEPVGRLGKPEEIASCVLWLCSEGAGFVTGQSIAVDGGWVTQ